MNDIPTPHESAAPAAAMPPRPRIIPAAAEPPPPDDPAEGDLARLLRSPARFVRRLADAATKPRLLLLLAVATLGGAALFGLAAGCFAGARVAALDAAKGAAVAAGAFLLCLPSLFVFGYIAGTTLPPRRIVALGAACTATAGCLFAALAPVVWLFAVSSESASFIVFLSLVVGAIGAWFAARPISALRPAGVAANAGGTGVWFAIFVVVALQMVSLCGPMLAEPDPAAPPAKGFFLGRIFDSLAAPAPGLRTR